MTTIYGCRTKGYLVYNIELVSIDDGAVKGHRVGPNPGDWCPAEARSGWHLLYVFIVVVVASWAVDGSRVWSSAAVGYRSAAGQPATLSTTGCGAVW